MAPLLDVLQHYQRSIYESQARLFHCINKLNQLPVIMGHREETTIAETINSLRKSGKEMYTAAENLAARWKSNAQPTDEDQCFGNSGEAKSVRHLAVLDNAVNKRRHNCDDDYNDLPQPKIAKSLPSTITTSEEVAADGSFPGFAVGQMFQAPSLAQMCTQVLQNNINVYASFERLKPILERVTYDILYVLEQHIPILIKHDDILWRQHVFHYYRTKQRHPNETWREMFIRCQVEDEYNLRPPNDSGAMPKTTAVVHSEEAHAQYETQSTHHDTGANAAAGPKENPACVNNTKDENCVPNKEEKVSKADIGGIGAIPSEKQTYKPKGTCKVSPAGVTLCNSVKEFQNCTTNKKHADTTTREKPACANNTNNENCDSNEEHKQSLCDVRLVGASRRESPDCTTDSIQKRKESRGNKNPKDSTTNAVANKSIRSSSAPRKIAPLMRKSIQLMKIRYKPFL